MLMVEDLQGLTRQALRELQGNSIKILGDETNKTQDVCCKSKQTYSEGDPVQVRNEDGEWLFATVERVKGNRISVRLAGYQKHEKIWLDVRHRSLRPFETSHMNFSRHRKRCLTQYSLRNGFSMLMTVIHRDEFFVDFEDTMKIWYEEHQTSLWQTTYRETRLSLGKNIEAPERFDAGIFLEKRSAPKSKIVEYFPKRKFRNESLQSVKSNGQGIMVNRKLKRSNSLDKTRGKGLGDEDQRKLDRGEKNADDDDKEEEEEEEEDDSVSFTDEKDLEYEGDFYEPLDRDEIETQAMVNDEILLDLDGIVSVIAKISKKKGFKILVDYVQNQVSLQKWLDLTEIRAFKMTSDYIERLRNETHPQLPLECRLRMRMRKRSRQSSFNDREGKHSELSGDDDEIVLPEGVEWIYAFVCNCCGKNIKDARLYCRYCRNPNDPDDNFDLCLSCFQYEFPEDHDHPKSSFSMQTVDYVYYQQQGEEPSKKSRFTLVKDVFLEEIPETTGKDVLDATLRSEYRTCVLCGDFEDPLTNRFLSDKPLVRLTERKEEKGYFWIHDYCARYSPEVYCDSKGIWFNVASAVRRGRSIKCSICKKRGATIGCFEPKCPRSFHLRCTGKSMDFFKIGAVFWCQAHEQAYLHDAYDNVVTCDLCHILLKEDWWSCGPCQNYYDGFDLCHGCYVDCFPKTHAHGENEFLKVHIKDLLCTSNDCATLSSKQVKRQKRIRRLMPDVNLTHECSYCGATECSSWRRGYRGVLMCISCSSASYTVALPSLGPFADPLVEQKDFYLSAVEDYAHQAYLTRGMLSITQSTEASSAIYLESYGPDSSQAYSLGITSSYYDIPGRAPRWATHSSSDYSGTWLPQISRWAVLRYSKIDERVLSNFLGRGTDVVETFLLGRRPVGVDINPTAIALSQKNCTFAVPVHLRALIRPQCRPSLVQGNAQTLSCSALFEDDSYDLLLSHPPYHHAIVYSNHIDGDLSRFASVSDFQKAVRRVADESRRVLKPGKRVVLGIGDNREHCFVVPIGFQTIREYLSVGFLLEELVIKRQRCCSGTIKGAQLSVLYDFFILTHEYIAVLRKPIHPISDGHENSSEDLSVSSGISHFSCSSVVRRFPTLQGIFDCKILGTVWIYRPSTQMSMKAFCMTQFIERLARDGTCWEEHSWKTFAKRAAMSSSFSENTLSSGDELSASMMNLDETGPDELSGEGEQQEEEDEDYTSRLLKSSRYPSQDDTVISEYELERQKRIQENNNFLRNLGLLGKTKSKSSLYKTQHHLVDTYLHITAKNCILTDIPANERLHLIFVPHFEYDVGITTTQLKLYRQDIEILARSSSERLNEGGYFIVGVQDVRLSRSDKSLIPMGLLVQNDLQSLQSLTLKEIVVVVPHGYARSRSKNVESVLQDDKPKFDGQFSAESPIPLEDFQFETDFIGDLEEPPHLPIVHTYYFLYVKQPISKTKND